MQFMMIVKATQESEAGVMPTEDLLSAMGRYNQQLIDGGILLAGGGLHPSSRGARVKLAKSNQAPVVKDGPFAETKELIAGYWIIQVKSKQEAIEWAKRIPNPRNEDTEVELRQVFEAADFGNLPPEVKAQEEAFNRQFEKKK